MPPIIIAIDGPSGAGKSTVARRLARELDLPYLDTGAMYRAIGLRAREEGLTLPISDPSRVTAIASGCRLDMATDPIGTRVSIDGRDVSSAIREPEISLFASAVSAIPEVRRLMVARQREIGGARGGVLEGRDIGTRVFPETPYKFYLTASESERARRRHRELESRGIHEPFEKVLGELHRRDEADSGRADSPLSHDATYTVVESDGLSADDVVALIRRTVAGPGPGVP